jgi:hypothetical protein
MQNDPETFEYEQEASQKVKMPPLTSENLKTLQSRIREKIDVLYAKYLTGGSSPKKTYLQICSRYCDVDEGYGSFINE